MFGISCYQQIVTEKIKNKTSDITRTTVQKSVCVLSRLPLYSQMQVKLSLIIQAYFEEGDFYNLKLIKESYSNLNSCMSDDMLHTQQLYVGLSARDFILHIKQRALVLLKLVLQEQVDTTDVRSMSPTSGVYSYIPTSDSISNLSSKVNDHRF